mgnify:CR=1 FL=1
MTASTSYFQTLPAEINKDARPFETSCACDETQDKALTTKCAIDGIPVDWPGDKSKHYNRIKMCDRNPEKDRKRRDIEGSDELTHEDFEVLMTPLKSISGLKGQCHAILCWTVVGNEGGEAVRQIRDKRTSAG